MAMKVEIVDSALQRIGPFLEQNNITWSYAGRYGGLYLEGVVMRTGALPISFHGRGGLIYLSRMERIIAEKTAEKHGIKLEPFYTFSGEDVSPGDTTWFPAYSAVCSKEDEIEQMAQKLVGAKQKLSEAINKLYEIENKAADKILDSL